MNKLNHIFSTLGEGVPLRARSSRLAIYEIVEKWPVKGVVYVGYSKTGEISYLSYIKKDNDKNIYHGLTGEGKSVRFTAHPVNTPPDLTIRRK